MRFYGHGNEHFGSIKEANLTNSLSIINFPRRLVNSVKSSLTWAQGYSMIPNSGPSESNSHVYIVFSISFQSCPHVFALFSQEIYSLEISQPNLLYLYSIQTNAG